jgi:putative endonuclease
MYYLYILKCADNSLYTGITNDLKKRINAHEKGNGSKYVRSRLPFKVVYTEKVGTKSKALKREHQIKSWSHQQKIKKLGLE